METDPDIVVTLMLTYVEYNTLKHIANRYDSADFLIERAEVQHYFGNKDGTHPQEGEPALYEIKLDGQECWYYVNHLFQENNNYEQRAPTLAGGDLKAKLSKAYAGILYWALQDGRQMPIPDAPGNNWFFNAGWQAGFRAAMAREDLPNKA